MVSGEWSSGLIPSGLLTTYKIRDNRVKMVNGPPDFGLIPFGLIPSGLLTTDY
jgi:hypothetical protein